VSGVVVARELPEHAQQEGDRGSGGGGVGHAAVCGE
jgi:hypothetical protein